MTSEQPKNSTRIGLTHSHIRLALVDGEWHTLSWIVATLWDKVSPEGAIRAANAGRDKTRKTGRYKSTEKAIRRGIMSRLLSMMGGDHHHPQLDRRVGENGDHEFRLLQEYIAKMDCEGRIPIGGSRPRKLKPKGIE